MSKHKKTRKEKIIADLRHKLYSFKNQDLSSSQTFSLINKEASEKKTITVKTPLTTVILPNLYPYLKHDVIKTLTLTLAIIVFQILLLFTLKKHVIVLPGLQY